MIPAGGISLTKGYLKAMHTRIRRKIGSLVSKKSEINKSHDQMFLVFVKMERIGKGSDLSKEKLGHRAFMRVWRVHRYYLYVFAPFLPQPCALDA